MDISPMRSAIHKILPVKKDAHSRFSARSRTYQYFISCKKDPFQHAIFMVLPGKLDTDLMNLGAEILKNNLDFTSFAKLPKETKTNICHIGYARWERKG